MITDKQAEILKSMRDKAAFLDQCVLRYPSGRKLMSVNIERVRFFERKKYIEHTWWMTDEITDLGQKALAEWEASHE